MLTVVYVVGIGEGGIVDRGGRGVAEIVADKRLAAIRRAAGLRTVELGVPSMFR